MNALVLEASIATEVTKDTSANHRLRNPRLVFCEIPEPQLAFGDDVIIEVFVNGICGSDVHVAQCDADGWVRFSGPANAPVVLGHEFVGKVVAIGRAVQTLRVGDIVSCESIQACGDCPTCRNGHYNQCRNVELVGLTINGGLAKCVVVKERHVHKVDKILDKFGERRGISLAACLEPIGCSFCGLFVDQWGKSWNGVRPGEITAVFGCGPIGLGAIALMRAVGVDRILAFDVHLDRVELAQKVGASAAFQIDRNNPGQLTEIVSDQTNGLGLDVIVEAAGDPDLFGTILQLSAARGRVIYLGRTPNNVHFDPNIIVSKAILIKGSRGHAGYRIFPTLIDLIASGRLDLTNFITARFNFTDAMAAFDHARDQTSGKILINVINGGFYEN